MPDKIRPSPTAKAGWSAKSKRQKLVFAPKGQAVCLNGAFSTDACYKREACTMPSLPEFANKASALKGQLEFYLK